MAYLGIESIRQAYAQELIKTDVTKATSVFSKSEQEPVFNGLAFHPESEPLKKDINDAVADLAIDLTGVNKELEHIASEYTTMMNSFDTRLTAVQELISTQEDHLRDINMICGTYKSFDSVKNINPRLFSGTFNFTDGYYTAPQTRREKPKLQVLDIQGNGYEGKTIPNGKNIETSRANLVDEDKATLWQYERFNSDSVHNEFKKQVNLDSEEAKATISLATLQESDQDDQVITQLKIDADSPLKVEEVYVSYDEGATYEPTLKKPFILNSKEERYTNPDYVYEAGLIAFPPTNKVKVRLSSLGASEEILPGISRCAIILQNIVSEFCSYQDGLIETGNLISSPVASLAIWCNEYIPTHFRDDEYIKYTLFINEKEYPIVPLNSNKIGTKVIRFSAYSSGDQYTLHIPESIKSAKLKIQIKCFEEISPFFSNLKLCIGKLKGVIS